MVNAPELVEVPKKTLWPLLLRRGGVQKLKIDQERRNQELLENSKMWFNQKLNNAIRMQMIHSLILKHAI
jgi:hypothetical protein